MSIIYIIIQIFTLINLLLIRKNNKKENILFWIPFLIIILMCAQIFIAFILSTIKLKTTLTNLSIIFIIINLLIVLYLYKSKKIQKYFIKKSDIIVKIILLIIVLVIGYMQYGFPLNINYFITDASNHYNATMNFYNNSELLNQNNTNDIFGIYGFSTYMPGHYVNLGILFKSLSVFLTNTKAYVNLFIIFELFILYLSGSLIYSLLSKRKNSIKGIFLAFIFTLAYIFGYQLNSEISGFSYLSLGMCIIISIITMLECVNNKKISKPINLIMLFLLNFSLFFTYYFFVPVVYSAIFIKLILENRKKIFTDKNIISILYILVLPFICGIYYFYLREWIKGGKIAAMNAISMEGDIYESVILNFMIFFIFIIAKILNDIKRKRKYNFINYLFVMETLFLLILYIGTKFNLVSAYYFNKAYYLLWILTIIISYKGCMILISKKSRVKKITYCYMLLISLFISITVLKENGNFFSNIYDRNYDTLVNSEVVISNDYFELIDYYKNNLVDVAEKIYIVPGTNAVKNRWLYQLYNNPYNIYELHYTITDDFNIENWINKDIEKEYIIYDKNDLNYEPKENDKYEILLNCSSGAILKRK